MKLSRTIRRVAAIAAALGIALQALLPALAQALPAQSIPVPVCSANGARHDIDLQLGNKRSAPVGEHCKLCLQGTDKLAAPGSANAFVSFDACPERIIERRGSDLKSPCAALASPRAPPIAS